MGLEHKKLLIVGGAAGIGAAIAREAASLGAAVAIADISQAGLDKTQREIIETGGTAETLRVDIANDDSVSSMAASCFETLGTPDILLITAVDYSTTMSGIDDMDVEDWERAFQVNFFGYIRVLKSLLPAMRERGRGTIVLTSSTVALFADRAASMLMRYRAVKFALMGLTQSLAVALEGSGLKVMAFCPGMTGTESALAMLRESQAPLAKEMMGYSASPDDVAKLFISGLENNDFLICSQLDYKDSIIQFAQQELNPNAYIANRFSLDFSS